MNVNCLQVDAVTCLTCFSWYEMYLEKAIALRRM